MMTLGISPPLLLSLNGQVDITVSRSVGGIWVKGVYKPNAPTTLTIKANIQPILKSTETQMLPEGDRSKEMVKVYTTSELLQRKEGVSPVQGDTFVFDGKTWEVMKVIAYKMGVLSHFKSICVRRELT
jgi:hypothetical protein